MLKKITLSFAVLSLSLMFSDYVMSRSSSPPAANTNAPNESSCAKAGCHNVVLNSGNGSVMITFPDTIYTPGATHTLTATVTDDSTRKRFGFQITSLDAIDTMMGTFIITNATNTTTKTLGNREYMCHKSATGTNSWTFDWTAPAAGAGTISFYMAGNAADSSTDNLGDRIYAQQFDWKEGPPATTVSITGASEICEDATASFSATAGMSSYKWSTGDTSATIIFAGTSSGVKTIWVLADSGLSSESSDTVTLMVHPTPAGPLVMDSASMNELHISNVAAGSVYQWYKGGSKMTGKTGTTLVYTEANDYHVEVTDTNGCTNVSNTVTVTIFVSVKFDLRSSISIYPNPSSGAINVNMAKGYSIDVMNISGQVVRSVSEIQDDQMNMELATGMYFIKLTNESGSVVTKVVIR